MRAARLAALLTLPIAAAALAHAQQSAGPTPASGSPQATFKTAIDVVSLDVSVLDRNDRPVRGLTVDDFVVLENGKPQSIAAFHQIDVPAPVTPPAAWMRDIGEDVVSNDIDTRRLVVIVLDDAYTGIDDGESVRARVIARAIVDQLGPVDLAAVAFSFLGTAQNFTADRARLLAAIDSYVPRNWTPEGSLGFDRGSSGGAGPPLGCRFKRGGCLVDLLKHIGTLLETAPGGRKIVTLISALGTMAVDLDVRERLTPMQEMFRALQRANVTVFAFDPRGLTLRPRADDVMSITDATGGWTIADTNEPEAHVARAFEQSASYYLLGFRSDDPRRDGRFRKLEVRVNRPDVRVRTRSGYFALRDERAKRSAATPLVRTLEHGLPGRDLPMRLNVAAFAMPGRREAAVTFVATLLDKASTSGGGRLELLATAFDTRWKERDTHRQAMIVRPVMNDGEELEFDVLSRLTLRPGRYEVRLAADSDGRTGSVIVNIDVPDFHGSVLALSDVLLARASSPVAGDARLLADLVPVTPTAMRVFTPADRVDVFARVYQGRDRALRRAAVIARITNDRDQAVHGKRIELDAQAFGSRREADFRERLPLSQLERGRYVLTLEAQAGGQRARRDVRFEVR
jgi:VWFA-related protein